MAIIGKIVKFREIEHIRDKEKRKPGSMFLMVQFQEIKHRNISYSVVYFEENSDAPLKVYAVHIYNLLIDQ